MNDRWGDSDRKVSDPGSFFLVLVVVGLFDALVICGIYRLVM